MKVCVGVGLLVAGGAVTAWSGTAVREGGYLEVTNVTQVALEAGAHLRKVGVDSFAADAGDLTGSGWTAEAFGGSMTIPAPPTREAVRPDAVLAKAALWLDATANVVKSGNAVTAWRDARETNPETDAYPRATSQNNITDEVPQFVASGAGVAGDLPSIWFGRLSSGRWMKFSSKLNVRHAFIVHGVTESYGNLIGTTSSPENSFFSGNLGLAKGPLFWNCAHYSAPVRGRVFLDRSRVDPTVTCPKDGWQLLELDLPFGGSVETLYNDRSLKNGTPFGERWTGGDNICEAVFFTTALTDAERLQVSDYLWHRWRSQTDGGPNKVNAYNGASVSVGCAAGTTNELTRTAGEGIGATYSGAVTLSDAEVTPITPVGQVPIGLTGGATLLPCYLPRAILATDGTSYAVAADSQGGGLVGSSTAEKESLVKTGGGSLSFERIPPTVTNIVVDAGELRIVAAHEASAPSEPHAFIEDGDFEGFTPNWNDNNRYIFFDNTSYRGWTYGKGSSSYLVQIPCNGIQPGWEIAAAPSGVKFASVQNDFDLSTAVTLPVAGVYSLSFKMASRKDLSTAWHNVEVRVDGSTIARLVVRSYDYRTFRYRLPYLTAGAHTISFVGSGSDVNSGLDDVRVEWIESGDEMVGVPNASFEAVPSAMSANVYESASNLPTGWTVTGNGGTALYGSEYCSVPMDGERILYLESDASAMTTVTFPRAGRYVVSAALSRIRPDSSFADASGVACLASVSVGGTTFAPFAIGLESTPKRCPLGICRIGDETLTQTLTIANVTTGGKTVLTVDSVEIRRLPDNLLVNGGFEEGDDGSLGWEFDATHYPAYASYARVVAIPYAEAPTVFGRGYFEGTRRLRIFHRGWARQDVTFDEPGIYRFVAHTCARDLESAIRCEAGRNPVEVRMIRGESTNRLGTVSSFDTLFRRYEFPFRIEEAGTYTLELMGMGRDEDDTTTFFDGLSIERVAEGSSDEVPMSAATVIKVNKGAKLALDFDGTNVVTEVRYGGRRVSGVIDATRRPDFVTGRGALFCQPVGMVILVR